MYTHENDLNVTFTGCDTGKESKASQKSIKIQTCVESVANIPNKNISNVSIKQYQGTWHKAWNNCVQRTHYDVYVYNFSDTFSEQATIIVPRPYDEESQCDVLHAL